MMKGHTPPLYGERKARWAPLILLLVALLGGHAIAPPKATPWIGGAFDEHPPGLFASKNEAESRSSDPNKRPSSDPATSASSSRPQDVSGWGRLWQNLQQNPIIAKIVEIGSWIGDGLRVLWAIPKAIVQGDSRALIEAIGQLLSRASPEASADETSARESSDDVHTETDSPSYLDEPAVAEPANN